MLSPRTTVFRGHVARAVAAFDLKRALDLLEPIADRNQRHAWLPQVAAAASVNQSEQSRALWEGLEPFYLSRAKAATACRLAEPRPDEALRIVESIEGDESPSQKVEALGWIAERVARRDKVRALTILDRALGLAMEPRSGNALVYGRDLPAKASMLAVHARRIGYPDLQSVSDRILASRPSLHAAGSTEQAFETSLAMAVVLAAVDPETAVQLLRVLEPQAAYLNATDNRRTKTQWFVAWALADPEHAVELADRQWITGSKIPGWDISSSGILAVPLVLSLPESEQLEIAVREMAGVSTVCPDE